MRNFRNRGQSSLIGHSVPAFVVRNNAPFEVELNIQLLPFETGLMYVARLQLLGVNKNHLLFDRTGKLQDFSPKLLPFVTSANLESKGIYHLLPHLK